MSSFYDLKLTAEQAVMLDGKVDQKNQEIINQAKFANSLKTENLSDSQKRMVGKIVSIAKEKSLLTKYLVPARRCPCCEKTAGYALHKGTGRYHKKGQPNHNKPLNLMVYDLDRGFVVMSNTVFEGYCRDCEPIVEPVLKAALMGIRAELPNSLASEIKYKRFSDKKCLDCGWEGYEGQMIKLRTMFNDGHYYGECPSCHAQNKPMGRTIIQTQKTFSVVEVDIKTAPQTTNAQ